MCFVVAVVAAGVKPRIVIGHHILFNYAPLSGASDIFM